MNVRRIGCLMMHVILLFTLPTGSSEGRKRTGKFLLGDRVAPPSPEIDEEVAEQLWIKCRSDLMHMKVVDGSFDSLRQDERSRSSSEVNSQVWSAEKGRLQKEINLLPPEKKQTLLGCLRIKNHLPYISGDARHSRNSYRKHVGSLYFSHKHSRHHRGNGESPRHHRGNGVHQHIAVTPVFAPAPGPAVKSSAYSPAPSSGPAPASFQGPGPEPPVERPTQPYFPPSSPSSIDSSSASPDLAPQLPLKKHNSSHKAVTVAVVTAVGTLAFAAMLFFCCRKCHRNNGGSGYGQKDDRPLLNLGLTNFSVGSSQKSFAMKKEKNGSQSFCTITPNGRVSSLGSNFSTEADIKNSSVPVGDINNSTITEAPSCMVASDPKYGHTSDIQAAIPPPPGRAAPPPPAPPPMPSVLKPGPPPPPPPKGVFPPPRPPPQAPIGPKMARPSTSGSSYSEITASDGEASKTKLKPFFWDKVLANPDHSMVWHQIKEGSFQFNEEMIETLFGYNAAAQKNKNECKKGASSPDLSPQYIQIIDSKKAQNLAILLRALNVTTEEVHDALQEGNELPAEFLQTLLKMVPTVDEELKLRLFSGDVSQLGSAERFLKMLIDIPFAFKRIDALFFMSSLQEGLSTVKESLATLEVACKELTSSRLFLKLLEAVLKTGNRMNDGTFRGGAQAFKLDTLLKLADVKGIDGKTTLLHFVVQEIIRSEGVRAARVSRENQSMSSVKSDDPLEDCTHDTGDHYRSLGLQVVSGLGDELENVRKAAALDAESVTGTLAKFGHSLERTKEFLHNEMTSVEENNGFHSTLKSFVEHAEIDITWLVEEEKRIMALVKSTADYFHGDAAKDEGLRLFVIIRDFLIMLDKACRQVRDAQNKSTKMPKNKGSPAVPSSPDSHHPPSLDLHRKLFPAIQDRRMDDFSSDEESTSP